MMSKKGKSVTVTGGSLASLMQGSVSVHYSKKDDGAGLHVLIKKDGKAELVSLPSQHDNGELYKVDFIEIK